MKKIKIVNRFRFTLFVTFNLLLIAIIIGSLCGMFDVRGAQKHETVSVEVRSGDTLWNLASDYGPAKTDIRRVVFEICRLNDISAETLQPGMIISIPKDI